MTGMADMTQRMRAIEAFRASSRKERDHLAMAALLVLSARPQDDTGAHLALLAMQAMDADAYCDLVGIE